ncbi:DUF6517 family protein [Haloarchaeobius sp. TZWWS8]|uniref:DUF6517 family protein n=1 Tax=Haloarchaeobius sp. TZWWS8 TaxID=3446121 RepID=UPI003EB869C2
MRTRRRVLAATAGVLSLSSGCLGFITGEEALEYHANKAVVEDDALGAESTGYTETSVENRTVEVNGQDIGIGDRTIRVENWVATYEKQDDFIDQTVGIFALVSTHQTDVLGQPMNPVRKMSDRELLDQVLGQSQTSFGKISNVQPDGTEAVTMLGKGTDVGVFTGEATRQGEKIEVKIYVTMVQHGDDYVIAIGGHPTKLPSEETDVLALMENVTHETN